MRRRSTRNRPRLHTAPLIAVAVVVAISMTIGRAISWTPGAGPNHAASQCQRKQSAPGPVPAGMAWIPKFVIGWEGASSQVIERPTHDAAACAKCSGKRLPSESEPEHLARSNASRRTYPKGPPASVNSRDDVALTIERVIKGGPFVSHESADGDVQNVQHTRSDKDPRTRPKVHRTDDGPEVAYDRASHVGKLDKALYDARGKGWVIVDMKNDWKMVFPSN